MLAAGLTGPLSGAKVCGVSIDEVVYFANLGRPVGVASCFRAARWRRRSPGQGNVSGEESHAGRMLALKNPKINERSRQLVEM